MPVPSVPRKVQITTSSSDLKPFIEKCFAKSLVSEEERQFEIGRAQISKLIHDCFIELGRPEELRFHFVYFLNILDVAEYGNHKTLLHLFQATVLVNFALMHYKSSSNGDSFREPVLKIGKDIVMFVARFVCVHDEYLVRMIMHGPQGFSQ